MSLRLQAALLCSLAMTPAAGVGAQDRQATAGSPRAYRAIVDEYRRYGSPGVTAIVEYSTADIAAAVDAALSSSGPDGWAPDELRGAAILHTEAMLAELRDKETNEARAHLDAALRFLDRLVARSSEHKEFTYRWFIVTPTLLRLNGAPAFAKNLAARIGDRFSKDELVARARFTDGLKFETAGCYDSSTLSAQSFIAVGQDSSLPSRWWLPAAREYQAALRRDPGVLQAVLHLGRIRMLEGKLDEALALFGRALAAHDPRVRYLASLFAGSIAERRSDFATAETRYRAALQHYRWGQSGQLALAQLFSRTGREAEARRLLVERFDGLQRIAEPLWTYVYRNIEDQIEALFEELRMEVGR